MSDLIDKSGSGEGATGFFGRIIDLLFGPSTDEQTNSTKGGDASLPNANAVDSLQQERPQESAGLSLLVNKSDDGNFIIHDDGFLVKESVFFPTEGLVQAVNQNSPLDLHASQGDTFKISDVFASNDEIDEHHESDAIGTYLSSHSFSYTEGPDLSQVANDLGHNVVLDASDVLNMGNNLVITGHELDSVNFQDEGWSRIDDPQLYPAGIEPRDGYDTYMHDSGAIVQIDHIINTNFDPHGHI